MPAFRIVLYRQIAKLDPEVPSAAIAKAEPILERLARKLSVVPLTEFKSQRPEDAAELMRSHGIDPEELELPEESWFSPMQGLLTVVALRDYLIEHPSALPNTDDVVEELDTWKHVLTEASHEGVAWHLMVVF